jgi:hypothetical protein
MRLSNEATPLEAAGALSVRRSSIQTSRKTFRMHIDSIYSDKIGAPVRELASNAFDSHLRASQDRKFFVHCPTLINPSFFVRDFGVGMSDDMMGDVYIVLGLSDKEQTDDEVGMWGLGSKSPFAYADHYNITCYDGQMARHYTFGIAEDGVPNLYLMFQEPCEDPRGVQVGFAVESKDFDAFKRAIEKVSVAHDGGFESNITLPKLGDVAFEGDGWRAYHDTASKLGNTTRWYARQGCVVYPIAAQEVRRPSDYQHKLTFILDCPIGTVRITPSRESIEYKPEVIAYLNERIDKVEAETILAIVEATKDITSVVEFFATVEKIKPSFITQNFTHALTGLTSPSLAAKWPVSFFETRYEHGRWEFEPHASIALKEADKRKGGLYLVDDISPLHDPSRGEHQGPLTRSEIRRVSRFTRAFLEARNATSATFVFNADWGADFRRACFGDEIDVVDLTFADLKQAVPTRVMPPKTEMKPAIRGLALAKAAGEQKPVFTVAAGQTQVAWVSSEQYRRQAANLFKVAKRFDIAMLYIAAPGVKAMLEDADIAHLSAVIDQGLQAHDLTFADWYYAKDRLGGYEIKHYVEFLRLLDAADPAAYAKLAGGKGEFSMIAKAARRLLPAMGALELSDEEKKAVDALMVDDFGKVVRPDPPPEMAGYEKALKTITTNYNNPTCKWIKDVQGLKAPLALSRVASAILYMQKLFPPSEKF